MAEQSPQTTKVWQDAVALLDGLGLADGPSLREERPRPPEIYRVIDGLTPSERRRVGNEAARLDAQLTDMRRSRATSAKSREQRRAAAEHTTLLNDAIRPLTLIASACGAESWREQTDADPAAFQRQASDDKQSRTRSRFGLSWRRRS